MRKRRGYIIWPEYFNRALSKRFGRALSKNLCVEDPRIEDLIIAVKKLGLKYEVENSSFPARWWHKSGRIIVEFNGPKRALLKLIAKELRRDIKKKR
ncbi:MAG: signal recognition particle subunit SRP19/SEC65 family protein [Candidatus Asgardarchaeia archaeon]